jgi:cyclophilin family peptidyl-prolyl cis-trans isomerase
MHSRLSLALVVATLSAFVATPVVQAQTVVRFETTAGDFDMVLNPTNDARLQEHVDNMVQNVEAQIYRGSWINRAPEGFVLQMGGFFSHTWRPVHTLANTSSVTSFDPITGVPASTMGLSNTVGTVALALSGNNPNSGSGSFFINLGSNTSLDAQFTVFAAIPDMTTIDRIMSFNQVDIRDEIGTDPGNVHYQDIPVDENNKQVIIHRTFVVTDSMLIAQAVAGARSVFATSQGGAASQMVPLNGGGAVPEPGTATLLFVGIAALAARRPRR